MSSSEAMKEVGINRDERRFTNLSTKVLHSEIWNAFGMEICLIF